MSQQQQTIKSINNKGNFSFDGTGKLITNCTSFTLNARQVDGYGSARYSMEGDDDSTIRTTSGNVAIETDNGNINILSKYTNSNSSILIQANREGGGIKLDSDYGGITSFSTGNIDLNAKNSVINLGVFTGDNNAMTNDIIMESRDSITASTTDFTITTSDAISLISLTGDISLGTTPGSSVIKFENDNLLINQSSSTFDRQLDVKITDEAISSPGYNGILINSSNSTVAPDITIQTADSNGTISMGVEPYNSNNSVLKTLIARQSGTSIISIDDSYKFSNIDIGRNIYWTSTATRDVITGIATYITDASNIYASSNLTTSGTYTGTNNRTYKIQIDSVGTPDTFRWSRDGGATYVQKYKALSTSATELEDGIMITFSASTGNTLNDNWTFLAKIVATTATSRTITAGERLNLLQPFTGYLKTSNISDIQIRTGNADRLKIMADGGLSIGGNVATSGLFNIANDYNTIKLINEYDTNYQINPSSASVKYGGFVVAWESKGQDGDNYGIYAQQFLGDGSKFGTQFRVNQSITTGNQSNPHVCGQNIIGSRDFMIVWMSEESAGAGIYNIYGQIYKNSTPLSATDILINSDMTTNKQLYPRVAGLSNGNYLIVWADDTANTGDYNIYGRIITSAGVLSGSSFKMNSSTTSLTRTYPYPFGLSDNDNTLSGGYGVVFMNEYSSEDTDGGEVSDDDRYNIQYRLFYSNGVAYMADTDITTSTGTRLTISDGMISATALDMGGFVVSFYRNYEGKASLYNVGDTVEGVSSGLNATIVSASGAVITVSGLTATDRFRVGEVITISNFWEERIASVSHNGGGNATITLSRGHKSVVMYKYNTNSTTPVYSNDVNTIVLVEDINRVNLYGVDYERSASIFSYRRPMSSIIEMGENNIVVAWSSGGTSSIYYRVFDSHTGVATTPREIKLSKTGVKNRNVVLSPIRKLSGVSGGFVACWDVEALDSSVSGIYGVVVNNSGGVISVRDGGGNINMELTPMGYFGVGDMTTSPIESFVIKGNRYDDYSNVVIQSGTNNKHMSKINVKYRVDGIHDDDTMRMEVGYDDIGLHPRYDNLIAYYRFDDGYGSNVLEDSTKNKYNGNLEDMDVYECWISGGKIGGAIEFNGSNNYILLGAVADLFSLGGGSYTISTWVNVGDYLRTSANLDIISNEGVIGAEGTYLFSVADIGSNGSGYLRASIATSSGYMEVEGRGVSIADGGWHMVSTVFNTANSKIQLYVDGVENNIATVSGTVSTYPSGNVYIGTRDASNGFFRGMMDDMRIYNGALSAKNLVDLYNSGNNRCGKMRILMNGGDNDMNYNTPQTLLTPLVSSIAQGLNSKNAWENFRVCGGGYSRLTGTLTFSESSNVVIGTNTKFLDELSIGDVIRYNTTEFVVRQVLSNTQLYVNRSSSSVSSSKIVKKPAMITMRDVEDNGCGVVDYRGNMIVGDVKIASSRLEVSGKSVDGYRPYLTLTNEELSDAEGGRETRLQFNGNTVSSYHTLGYIGCSHSGTGSDTKGNMRFFVNDGSTAKERVIIKNDGNVGVGYQTSPLGLLHIGASSGAECRVILSGDTDAEAVYGEMSKIFFVGSNSIADNPAGLMNSGLAAISGSSDYDAINVSGRLDFFTNSHIQDNGLTKRMSITSDGYVGVGVVEPIGVFQVSPKYSAPDGITGTQSGTTITLSENVLSDDIIGGVVVFDNARQTVQRITARPTNTTLTVADSETVANAGVSIYYPGFYVDNSGNVAIGVNSSLTKLHVEGGLSTSIKTKSSDYTTTLRDNAILGDATGGQITITLGNMAGISGLIYTIKKIDDSGNVVRVETTNGTIDGSTYISLSTQYKYITVQADGSNWYIVGSNI